MVYIRQDKLPKLREYKYSGVDHSLVSRYVLKPFYSNVVIHCFPMWMAPNLITLTGFSFVVVNFLTLLWYNPTLDQDCPPWVYLSWAVGLFLYQTFDAIDGSQARRTHQSGPLGELFDHAGVDAINTTLEVLIFSACMNLGQGWKTVLTLFASSMTFYVQTWEEYHTHTLTLGLISGPVEGILTLCIVYAVTAFLGGGSFWQHSLLESIGIRNNDMIPDSLYKLAWNEWYMVYGGVVLVYNTISSAKNVMDARRARGQRARIALLGLLTFAAAWILIGAYLYLQPIILHYHLVPFVFFAGLINAFSVGRMIISHLTKSRFPRGNVLMYPLIYGVIDSLGPRLQEHIGVGWPSALGNDVYQVAFVFMCLGLAIGVHGSFVVDVIWTICDYLDIWCLTIKYPYAPVKGELEAKERIEKEKKGQ
ncbi:Choline/ethanolaminephosphotransferase [Westerdykella ornata]|uniref:diacylglycerol cholinephosphotransferase n=1 Tax=Westerdykella ornata TaxID=318751 RepID=A0A6A6JDG5_WESOR|nr:Choline/ethanolaminephosphotransferase [Westerdykella ornata]KAF2274472.1 Choline/ethanolaminephosphotransferase [Westerdykella ornata]